MTIVFPVLTLWQIFLFCDRQVHKNVADNKSINPQWSHTAPESPFWLYRVSLGGGELGKGLNGYLNPACDVFICEHTHPPTHTYTLREGGGARESPVPISNRTAYLTEPRQWRPGTDHTAQTPLQMPCWGGEARSSVRVCLCDSVLGDSELTARV